MSFAWPLSFLALVAVPAVLGAYLVALRRRRRRAVTYSSLALLRQAIPRRSRWLRHVPIGLLLASLAVLALAAARPQLTEAVPTNETSIILALDESGSMCSTDLTPDRLAVAQKAALHYVADEPNGTKIGIVLFNGFAELAVPPTTNRAELYRALDNLTTGPGTAIGAAMLQALNAIAAVDPSVAPIGAAATIGGAAPSNPFDAAGNSGVTLTPERTTPKGGYVPDVVVLLTDGQNNRGISPLQAAPYAVAAQGPRLHDRLRDDEPGAARLHTAAAGRGRHQWRLRFPGRLRWRWLRRRWLRRRWLRRESAGRGPPTAPRGVTTDGRRELHGALSIRADQCVREPPEADCRAETAPRDHLGARALRCAPRAPCARGGDPLEPLPLGGWC